MARGRETEPTDDDGMPDEVVAAENAKIIADAQVALTKARIMEESVAALERLNEMTAWKRPKKKITKSTSRSRSRSK